jgi:hypothetical protein
MNEDTGARQSVCAPRISSEPRSTNRLYKNINDSLVFFKFWPTFAYQNNPALCDFAYPKHLPIRMKGKRRKIAFSAAGAMYEADTQTKSEKRSANGNPKPSPNSPIANQPRRPNYFFCIISSCKTRGGDNYGLSDLRNSQAR